MLLIIGGVAGIVGALLVEAGARTFSDLGFVGFAVLLFAGSVWIGVDLWSGKPRGYKWAKVLLLLQVPNISIPGFSYQFYSGLMLGLSFSREADSKLNLLFELGSQMNFQFSRAVEDLVFGVNLVALAAFIYLIKASKETAALGTAAGSL